MGDYDCCILNYRKNCSARVDVFMTILFEFVNTYTFILIFGTGGKIGFV